MLECRKKQENEDFTMAATRTLRIKIAHRRGLPISQSLDGAELFSLAEVSARSEQDSARKDQPPSTAPVCSATDILLIDRAKLYLLLANTCKNNEEKSISLRLSMANQHYQTAKKALTSLEPNKLPAFKDVLDKIEEGLDEIKLQIAKNAKDEQPTRTPSPNHSDNKKLNGSESNSSSTNLSSVTVLFKPTTATTPPAQPPVSTWKRILCCGGC
jgi:hypothetical protein